MSERIWEKKLKDGTSLIGVTGDASHTHIGSGFVSIRDEKTGNGLHWSTPDFFENEKPFHSPGCTCGCKPRL